MDDRTLDRETVLELMDETVHMLQRDPEATRLAACDALGIGSAEWRACRDQMIDDLQEAEDWAEREEAIASSIEDAPPIDSEGDPEYIPSHPTLALFQSAMDEQFELNGGRSFLPGDPRWVSVLYQKLRARVRGKAPFPQHRALDDFRFDLADRGTVALVSDWGTANVHAVAVAQQIAARDPDHIIHLGDVYYSGTPREMERNFLGVWRAHGPHHARYWGLNSNHDMYSGGYGYFQHALPAFEQPASYFSLRNRHWQLVGLDSAYVNHNFNAPQIAWLDAQLSGPFRSVLLTHHHLFSAFRKPGHAMAEWVDPYVKGGRIHGWFWGHEHHLIEYAERDGVKHRCIGHGSLPYVPPDRKRRRYQVDISRMETRPSPQNTGRGIHGFALLTFDGPAMEIEYVDEAGGTAWRERWR
jgi:hypothetical protein